MSEFLTTTLGRTRLIAFVEGISFIIIIFITMPLKYLMAMPAPNKVVGMAHGLLFVAYILAIIQAKIELGWSWKLFFIAFVASFVPFGTFYLDKKYLQANVK